MAKGTAAATERPVIDSHCSAQFRTMTLGIGRSKSRTFVHSTHNFLRSHQRQVATLAASARAAQAPDLQNSTSFFTNFASRLLHAQLSVDLNRIQLFPTNQYTPA